MIVTITINSFYSDFLVVRFSIYWLIEWWVITTNYKHPTTLYTKVIPYIATLIPLFLFPPLISLALSNFTICNYLIPIPSIDKAPWICLYLTLSLIELHCLVICVALCAWFCLECVVEALALSLYYVVLSSRPCILSCLIVHK